MNVKKAAVIVVLICVLFIAGIVAVSLNSEGWSWFNFSIDDDFEREHFGIGGRRVDIDESAQMSLEGAEEISVSLPAGNLTVEVGEPSVTLKGYITLPEEKEKYLFVTEKNGKVNIEFKLGDLPFVDDSHIEMTVRVPQQLAAELKVDNMSGDIRIKGITMQNTTITNMSGNMEISGCKGGALSTDLMSGNITVTDGDFTSVDAVCQSGNVRIGNGNGPINVENTSGNIDIAAVSGAIDASNTSGNIDVSLSGPQVSGINADVSSGNITVRLNSAAAFTLDAQTSSGNIGCDFDILVNGGTDRGSLNGDCNGGGELVKLSVDSGNINVFKG